MSAILKDSIHFEREAQQRMKLGQPRKPWPGNDITKSPNACLEISYKDSVAFDDTLVSEGELPASHDNDVAEEKRGLLKPPRGSFEGPMSQRQKQTPLPTSIDSEPLDKAKKRSFKKIVQPRRLEGPDNEDEDAIESEDDNIDDQMSKL